MLPLQTKSPSARPPRQEEGSAQTRQHPSREAEPSTFSPIGSHLDALLKKVKPNA